MRYGTVLNAKLYLKPARCCSHDLCFAFSNFAMRDVAELNRNRIDVICRLILVSRHRIMAAVKSMPRYK